MGNGKTEEPEKVPAESKKVEVLKENGDSKKDRKSSSSSSKHRSSSKHSSNHHKSHHKSSRHDSSSSSSSHKHKSKSKSTHKSSSSSSKHKSSSSKDRKKEDEKKKREPSADLNFSTSSDDDIEEQCRQIFEDYKPVEKTPLPAFSRSKPVEAVEEPQVVDKRRQAHENASSNVTRQAPMIKPNHSQSALVLAQRRQDVALHKALAESKAKDEEIARLEAEIREKESAQLTPLIDPKVFQRPAGMRRPLIVPISHRMAIEAAKRKVDELQKAKLRPFQNFTPCQTAAKTSGRVAHAPSKITDIDPCKLAPPIREAQNTKISSNIRTQYYQLMVRTCLQIYPLPADAFDRAQTEEFTVFGKCTTPQIYKTSVLLALNRLKKEIDKQNGERELKTFSHDVMLAGKIGQRSSWSVNNKVKVANSDSSLKTIDNCSSSQAFALFAECALTEQQLRENGFPRAGEARGGAQLFTPRKPKPPNGKEGEHYCARCHKVFNVDIYDTSQKDLCNFHLKRSGYRRGHADNLYYCCQQPSGTDGCCFANYHVTDYLDHDNLVGYVTTMEPPEEHVGTKSDIFALDCEMCYTVGGFELTRITVVGFDEKVVFDSFVRPQNRVIDYNTKFSGITEATLRQPNVKSLPEIQAVLLSMFNSQTILVGHSLESDLKALKLIHGVVVDTSVLYPHKMGLPKKRALKTLCIENLQKVIQEDGKKHHQHHQHHRFLINFISFPLRRWT